MEKLSTSGEAITTCSLRRTVGTICFAALLIAGDQEIRNAPGILSSSVASTAPLARASSKRCPSVVCFGDLTHVGSWETSWSSEMNVKGRASAFFMRNNKIRACVTVIPYDGAWPRTRTNPNSVIEHVAIAGNRAALIHAATRSWNSW